MKWDLDLHTLRARLAGDRLLAAVALLYLASQATIAAILHDLGLGRVLVAQTTFSKQTLLAIFHEWESEGLLARYEQHFIFDFAHPIWYACLLAGLIARGLDRRRASDRWNALLLLPVLAGLMDLAENGFHVRFLADRGAVTQTLVTLSALATNLKWALAVASIALILGLFLGKAAPAKA